MAIPTIEEVQGAFTWALESLRYLRLWMEGIFLSFFLMWGVVWVWVMILDLLWGGLLALFGLLVWLIMLILQLVRPDWFANIKGAGQDEAHELNWVKSVLVGNLINWVVVVVTFIFVAGFQSNWSGEGFNVWFQAAVFVGVTFAITASYAWIKSLYERSISQMQQSGFVGASSYTPFIVIFVALGFLVAGFWVWLPNLWYIWVMVLVMTIILAYFLVVRRAPSGYAPTGATGGQLVSQPASPRGAGLIQGLQPQPQVPFAPSPAIPFAPMKKVTILNVWYNFSLIRRALSIQMNKNYPRQVKVKVRKTWGELYG